MDELIALVRQRTHDALTSHVRSPRELAEDAPTNPVLAELISHVRAYAPAKPAADPVQVAHRKALIDAFAVDGLLAGMQRSLPDDLLPSRSAPVCIPPEIAVAGLIEHVKLHTWEARDEDDNELLHTGEGMHCRLLAAGMPSLHIAEMGSRTMDPESAAIDRRYNDSRQALRDMASQPFPDVPSGRVDHVLAVQQALSASELVLEAFHALYQEA